MSTNIGKLTISQHEYQYLEMNHGQNPLKAKFNLN